MNLVRNMVSRITIMTLSENYAEETNSSKTRILKNRRNTSAKTELISNQKNLCNNHHLRSSLHKPSRLKINKYKNQNHLISLSKLQSDKKSEGMKTEKTPLAVKRGGKRRVCFRQSEEVHEFTPISDPFLKNKLYYSQRDLMTMGLEAQCVALEYKLKKLKQKNNNIKSSSSPSSSLYHDPKFSNKFSSQSLILMLDWHQNNPRLSPVQQLHEHKQLSSLEQSRSMLKRMRIGTILKRNHDQLRQFNDIFLRNNFIKEGAINLVK
mmetsp:Transcript_26718/g.39517  ORF Transcript_26718/g.39517 Transcript_26718/m.39517 type:complete len:265 (-) Transcript_26718:63-857(-)